MNNAAGAIYAGRVVHRRSRPKAHLLKYRVFSLLLDLDRLDEIDKSQSLLNINRWGILSFLERDHGDGGKDKLRDWVNDRLTDAGFNPSELSVQVLCYPRILGYVFNPLTVYFCNDGTGRTRVILYQVNNTFSERHTYVLPVENGKLPIHQACDKAMYVSPFTPMDCRYGFSIVPPAERVAIVIRQSDKDGPLLNASFTGNREALTTRNILGAVIKHPLMTLKVVAGIHYEAFRLWRKGVPYFTHEPQQRGDVSIVKPIQSKQGI